MYCPQCGTKSTTGQQRFCRECGAAIGAAPSAGAQNAAGAGAGPRIHTAWGAAQRLADQAWSASSTTPPFQRPLMLAQVTVKEKGNIMKPLLIGAGLLLLLPVALAVLAATLFAGVALLAVIIKAAPLIGIAFLVYWIATRQRRTSHSGR